MLIFRRNLGKITQDQRLFKTSALSSNGPKLISGPRAFTGGAR